jgi:hypothetical protein
VPDLNFEITGAEAIPYAVTPQLAFKLAIENATGEAIHTVALRCQIQIETARRRYNSEEQNGLRDLFGEPSRWGQTLKTMLWTHANLIVTAFEGSTQVDLPVECSFDFNIAATKYFAGLEDGNMPLLFQFSGTVFYAADDGALQVSPISWSKETKFPLPVKVWREMMEIYYPNSAWLSLRRDVFDSLYRHKVRHGIPTWEQALEGMIPQEGGAE